MSKKTDIDLSDFDDELDLFVRRRTGSGGRPKEGRKHHVAVKMSASQENAMKPVWKDKYGVRGRSRWIEEAVVAFLNWEAYTKGDFSFDARRVWIPTEDDPCAKWEVLSVEKQEAVANALLFVEAVEDACAYKDIKSTPDKLTFSSDAYQILLDAKNKLSELRPDLSESATPGLIRAAIERALVDASVVYYND